MKIFLRQSQILCSITATTIVLKMISVTVKNISGNFKISYTHSSKKTTEYHGASTTLCKRVYDFIAEREVSIFSFKWFWCSSGVGRAQTVSLGLFWLQSYKIKLRHYTTKSSKLGDNVACFTVSLNDSKNRGKVSLYIILKCFVKNFCQALYIKLPMKLNIVGCWFNVAT